METLPDIRPTPERDRLGSLDPAKLWMLGLALEGSDRVTGPGLRQYSYWAACDCPDDCLIDHENE